MNIRVIHTSLIFSFVNEGFDSSYIYSNALKFINEVILENEIIIPEEWVLIFDVGYNNGRKPLVSRNKVGSYPSDKMKYIKIVIPIPLKSEVEWGVDSEQYLYEKDHYDKLMKNFFELDIDYRNYVNRTDYITSCLKIGIKRSFEEGFTVGGVKIKAKNNIKL